MIVLLHTEQFTATQVLSSGAWAVNSGWPRLCSQPGLSTGLPSVPGPTGFLAQYIAQTGLVPSLILLLRPQISQQTAGCVTIWLLLPAVL